MTKRTPVWAVTSRPYGGVQRRIFTAPQRNFSASRRWHCCAMRAAPGRPYGARIDRLRNCEAPARRGALWAPAVGSTHRGIFQRLTALALLAQCGRPQAAPTARQRQPSSRDYNKRAAPPPFFSLQFSVFSLPPGEGLCPSPGFLLQKRIVKRRKII